MTTIRAGEIWQKISTAGAREKGKGLESPRD